jgi:hypothetical protein
MEDIVTHTMVIEIPHKNMQNNVGPQRAVLHGFKTNIESTWAELYKRMVMMLGWGCWTSCEVQSVEFYADELGQAGLWWLLGTALVKVVTRMTQDKRNQLDAHLGCMPYRWYPDKAIGEEGHDRDGRLMVVHWFPDIRHDEGVDSDGVRIFHRDRSIGTLELTWQYATIDYYGWDTHKPMNQSMPVDSCSTFEPHAIAAVSFVKPTKSAGKSMGPRQ